MTQKKHRNDGLQKICGCARKAWSSCKHSWHFSFQWKGTHHKFSLDRYLGRRIEGKTEAESEAEQLRVAIRGGTFGKPAPKSDMTVRQLADEYLERYVKVKRVARYSAFANALRVITATTIPHPTGPRRPLGDWVLVDVVPDTMERFREARLQAGTGSTGTNRYLGYARAMWSWGLFAEHVTSTPFKRNGVAVVKLEKEHARSRRLEEGEEGKILAGCKDQLHSLVVAAIETGMRRGELLSLQWSQVEGLTVEEKGGEWVMAWPSKASIFLPHEKTKTKTDRRIPISTRLKAVLEMRRLDPAAKPHPADAYVFGTDIGTRVLGFKRAWMTAVLRAHGHSPEFSATANLTRAGRNAFKKIDLHFHDLRREAGSRWLEGGVPLHTVRSWLGHSNIAQTSTYLSGTLYTEHEAMRRYETRFQQLGAAKPNSEDLGSHPQKPRNGRPRTAGRKDGRPKKTVVGLSEAVN